MTLAQRILAAVQAEAEYHDEGDHQIAARDLALPEISNRDEVLAAIDSARATLGLAPAIGTALADSTPNADGTHSVKVEIGCGRG